MVIPAIYLPYLMWCNDNDSITYLPRKARMTAVAVPTRPVIALMMGINTSILHLIRSRLLASIAERRSRSTVAGILDIDSQFVVAIDKLRLTQNGEVVYGWNRKSVGCRVIDGNNEVRWARVQSRAKVDAPGKLWYGLQESEQLNIERKPHLLESSEWETEDRVWRGELMTFVPFEVCSTTPELKEPIQLNSAWFQTLRSTLSSFSDHETERVNTRQDLVTRRLQERFGDKIDPQVSEWTTAHGDIHWANLTQPECWLLDWEAWGRAPKGFDAALLYGYSLMCPEIAQRVYETFQQTLMTPDGIRSQLFICVELMRMTELYGDHPTLYSHLRRLSESLIQGAPR